VTPHSCEMTCQEELYIYRFNLQNWEQQTLQRQS